MFPTFIIYIIIITAVGIPLLTLTGYVHFKRTPSYRSEAAINMESNPFVRRTLINSEFIKPGRDEFWADPFVISVNKKNYVFFENYSYKSKKGKISCGILSDGKIENISDALEFDYHLSYPFIFKMDNAIYMMPETVEAKRLEIYKAIDFPTKWKLYSTGF